MKKGSSLNRKIFNSQWIVIFIILLFSLIGIKALFHPGFFTSHDGWHQLVRLLHFHQAVVDGHFPPRWAGLALNGYGYPLFYFTYQIPFYLAEIFRQLQFSLWDSIKIVFILGYVASGYSMYFFAKKLWGKWGGLLSSILYLWAPFRFSNIFVRGSLGEHFTYIFIPLIFLALWQASQLQILFIKGNRCEAARGFKRMTLQLSPSILILAIGFAGIILSHAIVLQLLIIPLAIYWPFLFIISRDKVKLIFTSILGGLLGVGLAGFYFIPALNAKQYIQGLNPYYFSDHFVYLKQYLYSPWGFGFSFPGLNDGMSFQLGFAQWLAIFISFFAVIILALSKKLKPRDYFVVCLLLIFLISSFLMLPPSRSFWESILKIITLDYPWRYLTITTFIAATLAGYPIYILQNEHLPQIKYITNQLIHHKILLYTLYFILSTTLALYANRNHIIVNLYEQNPMQYVNATDTSNTFDEYAPKWFHLELAKKSIPVPPIEFKSGTGSAKLIQRKTNLQSFQVSSTQSAQLQINHIWYPGWSLYIDDQKQAKSINGDGLWEFSISQGEHHLKLILKEPLINKISNIISLISLIIFIKLFIQIKKNKLLS